MKTNDFFVNRVAILGRPNAGKSTLLNSLLDTPFSGTSARPQTTRTNIRGVLQSYNEDNDWVGQVVIVDTPGVNLAKGLLERAMHTSIEEALRDVETVVWVADARTWSKDLRNIQMERVGGDKVPGWLKNAVESHKKNWVLVLSKMDLVNPNEVLPLIEKTMEIFPKFSEIVPVSSLAKDRGKTNLRALIEVLEKYSQASEPIYDEAIWTDLNQKQLIQNLIREAIFRQSKEEIPYKADTTIVSYKDPEGLKKMPEIHAYIWVSKSSMKPILVGKRGQRISELGKAVRERYEDITGEKIVLKLFVKVVEKWESRAASLSELGYVFASQ